MARRKKEKSIGEYDPDLVIGRHEPEVIQDHIAQTAHGDLRYEYSRNLNRRSRRAVLGAEIHTRVR